MNPTDIAQTTEELYRALTMDEPERASRMRAMRAVVEQGTPQRWLELQLAAAAQ